MNENDQKMLSRINKYAEEVLADINPQKTRISFQLEKLKPVMEEIAKEEHVSTEEIFIKYMDLASEFAAESEKTFQQDMGTLEFKIPE